MAGIEFREGDVDLPEELGRVVEPGGARRFLVTWDKLSPEQRQHLTKLTAPLHPKTHAEHHFRQQQGGPWRRILATIRR